MMRRVTKKASPAYLTVYLAIILAMILSLYLALIEGVRSNAIRLEAECVTDIAMNSVLAEYHRELLKQYNLFAVDTSYGVPIAVWDSTEELAIFVGNLKTHLQKYLDRNMSMEDVFLSDFLYRDFLALSAEKLEMQTMQFLTDEQGAVFRKRAVEAVKNDVGLDLMEDLAQWLDVFEENELRERDIAAEKETIDDRIKAYDGKQIQVSKEKWITLDIDNPTDKLEELRAKGILQNVIDRPGQLSTKRISRTALISERLTAGKAVQGNCTLEKMDDAEEWLERFFFQEYIIRYMGRYGRVDTNNALLYQLEYLVSGQESDVENLHRVVETLCAIRWVANVVYLYSDEEKCAQAELLATVLAALLEFPEIASLFKGVLLLGWAYAESLYDVESLLEGGSIPLIKDADSWRYDLESALNSEEAERDAASGLCYEDYLRILMCFTDLDTLTLRAMDMVEADIRQSRGNEGFRLDTCCDCVGVRVTIGSKYGYQYEVTREKKYR